MVNVEENQQINKNQGNQSSSILMNINKSYLKILDVHFSYKRISIRYDLYADDFKHD